MLIGFSLHNQPKNTNALIFSLKLLCGFYLVKISNVAFCDDQNDEQPPSFISLIHRNSCPSIKGYLKTCCALPLSRSWYRIHISIDHILGRTHLYPLSAIFEKWCTFKDLIYLFNLCIVNEHSKVMFPTRIYTNFLKNSWYWYV